MFKKRKQLIDTVKNLQFSVSSLKIALDSLERLVEYYRDELLNMKKSNTEAIEDLQKDLDGLAPYNMMLHSKKSITTSVGHFELPQDPFAISKPPTDFELNVIILKSHTEPTYVEVWCKDKDETNLVFSKLLSIYGLYTA